MSAGVDACTRGAVRRFHALARHASATAILASPDLPSTVALINTVVGLAPSAERPDHSQALCFPEPCREATVSTARTAAESRAILIREHCQRLRDASIQATT